MELFIYIYLICSTVWSIFVYSCFCYEKYKYHSNIKISLIKLVINFLFWPITMLGTIIRILIRYLIK